MSKIRFQSIGQPDVPPPGKIWLWYDQTDQIFKMMRDDASVEPVSAGDGSVRLRTLVDVDIDVSPSHGHGLRYDSSISKWINSGVVVDSLVGSETDVAPSVDAVKDYIATRHVVEYVVLDASDISAKQVSLDQVPVIQENVTLDVIGGGAQCYIEDFTVSGSTLSWNGLGLDGILSEGDKLRISYFK